MQSGFQAQLDAFVAFIQNDPVLLKAVQQKDWRTFALHYNGNVGTKKHPKVRDGYDKRLANAYAQIVSQKPANSQSRARLRRLHPSNRRSNCMSARRLSPSLMSVCSLLLSCGTIRAVQPHTTVEARGGQAAAVSPVAVSEHPLTSAEYTRAMTRVKRSAIPRVLGEVQPNTQQSFAVKGQGFPEFAMVPVRYESTSEDNQEPTYRCGVFVVPAGAGASSFVRTLGYDNREAEVCDGLVGVGFLADHGRPPRIILLYNGGSFNAPGKDPVVLAWDPKANGYASDDEVVKQIGDAKTIPAIQARLRRLRP